MAAAHNALRDGLSFGAPNNYEAEMAELICRRYPSCERVRFCNSGTEANLMAIVTARAQTGREKIVVMNGGYHGSVLKFAGGGSVTNVPFPYLVSDYNDLDGAIALLERHADSIAAVLVEPIIGSGGCIPANPEFLDGLRKATTRLGILLIFDEVMSSRLSFGGMQERTRIIPDLTTFGKYMGGGFSFGAFGGAGRLMDAYDPEAANALVHAGTFNNNVMSMRVGLTGLRDIYGRAEVTELNSRGDELRTELNRIVSSSGCKMQFTGIGSMLAVHFQCGPIERPQQIDPATEKRALFHLSLLEAGVYIARRGFMTLSLALDDSDYSKIKDAVRGFAVEFGHLI